MDTFFRLAAQHDQDEVDYTLGIYLIEKLCRNPLKIHPDFYNAFSQHKPYRMYQIKLFANLLGKQEAFWNPDSRYYFVWNSNLSFIQMRLGMYLIDDKEALDEVLSADSSVLDHYIAFFHLVLTSGVPFSEVSWMFRQPAPRYRLERMLRIHLANPTIPLKLFLDKANAEKFYQYCSVGDREEYLQNLVSQPLYAISPYSVKNDSGSPRYVRVQPVLSDLDMVDRVLILLHELAIRFPDVPFDRLLTEKTINMPAVIKMLMDKSCSSLEQILKNHTYPAEILAEWYDWTCCGLNNFESVYNELLFAASQNLYSAITPTDLALKLQKLKEIAITCKRSFLPFPVGICHCDSLQDMQNYFNLYAFPIVQDHTLTKPEVQCLFNYHHFSRGNEFPDSGIMLSFDSTLILRDQNMIRRAIEKCPSMTEQLLTGKTY